MNKLEKIKSTIEIVGLLWDLKNMAKCAHRYLSEKEISNFFNTFNRSYKKAAAKQVENIKNSQTDSLTAITFTLSSLGNALLFVVNGDYEASKKIAQFALNNSEVNDKKSLANTLQKDGNVFQKIIDSCDLRLVAVQIEAENPGISIDKINKNNYSQDVLEQLEVLKAGLTNSLGNQVTQSGKPGELALLYFMLGDTDTARTQLEILAKEKNTKATQYLLAEVYENVGLAVASPIVGKVYVDFVKTFIVEHQAELDLSGKKQKMKK